MSRIQILLPRYFYSFMLVLLFITCNSKEESSEEAFDINSDLTIQEKKMLGEGIQKLSDWVQHWKEVDASFNPEAFEFERRELFEELEWPEENFIVPDNPFYPYLLPNPDGVGFVDIYSYKVFVPAEGKPGFQPDSEVIYFKSNGMRERLLFIGPSGGFEDAVWLDAEYLLVSGFFEEEEGVTPKIWLIDTAKKSYSIFRHPFHTTFYAKDGYLKKKLSNLEF
jgi:hypothetical protein